MRTRICTFVLTLGSVCCLLISIPVTAKEWQGIVPLHSNRADVKKLLGKPLSEESSSFDSYDVAEGRVEIMYVREKCEQGLPANWGNWNVPPDTVVNISISLNKPIPLTKLGVPNIKDSNGTPTIQAQLTTMTRRKASNTRFRTKRSRASLMAQPKKTASCCATKMRP